MTDDIAEFWEDVDDDVLDAFGAVAAEYRPREGAPVPLTVIFRTSRGVTEMRAPALARPERVGTRSFTAKGSRHVLEVAREGETLIVQGEAYTISDVKFEGVGLVTLRLQGPVVEPAARQNAGPAGGR